MVEKEHHENGFVLKTHLQIASVVEKFKEIYGITDPYYDGSVTLEEMLDGSDQGRDIYTFIKNDTLAHLHIWMDGGVRVSLKEIQFALIDIYPLDKLQRLFISMTKHMPDGKAIVQRIVTCNALEDDIKAAYFHAYTQGLDTVSMITRYRTNDVMPISCYSKYTVELRYVRTVSAEVMAFSEKDAANYLKEHFEGGEVSTKTRLENYSVSGERLDGIVKCETK